MVSSCSALYCSSRDTQESKANGISFHRFPKNPKLRRAWARAARPSGPKRSMEYIPPKSANLCSKHFAPENFEVHQCRKRLRDGVIPTIFYFPQSFLKPRKPRLPSQRSSSNEDGKMKVCCAQGCGNTNRMRPRRVSFHEFPSNAQLRAQWIKAVKNSDFFVPTSNSVLCSVHFTNDQFKRAHVLKFGAIPSIFHTKSSDPQPEQEEQCMPAITSCSVPLKRLKMDPGDVVRVLTVLPSEFADDTLSSPGNEFEGDHSDAMKPLDVEPPEYETTTPGLKNRPPEICSDHIYASTITSVLNDHQSASLDANSKLTRMLLGATNNISKECNLENPTNMEVPVSPDVVFLCKNSKDLNPKPLLISGLPSVGGKPLLISNQTATTSQTSAIVNDIISRARQAALKAVSAKGSNSPVLTGASSDASNSPVLLLVQQQTVSTPTSQLVTSLNQTVPLSQSLPRTTSAQRPSVQKPKTVYTLAGLTPETSNIPPTSSASHASVLNYMHLNSKLNRQLATSKSVIKNYQRKVKNLTGVLRRQKLKIQSMEKELAKLMKKKAKYDQFLQALEQCPPKNRALLESQLQLTTGNEAKVYSDEVKVFASTLYCYSTKAYAYVRNSLLTSLPNRRTILRWSTPPEPSSQNSTLNSHSEIAAATNTISPANGNTQPVPMVSWCNPSEVVHEGSSRESATEGKETVTADGQQNGVSKHVHENELTAPVQENDVNAPVHENDVNAPVQVNDVNAPRPTLQPTPQTASSENGPIVVKTYIDNTVAASSIAQESNASSPRTIYLYIPENLLPVGSVSFAVSTETTDAIAENNGTHLPVTVIGQISQDVSHQGHAEGSTHEVVEAVDCYVEENVVSTIEHVVEQQENCADVDS